MTYAALALVAIFVGVIVGVVLVLALTSEINRGGEMSIVRLDQYITGERQAERRLDTADQLLRSFEVGVRNDERARIVAGLRALGEERPQLAVQMEAIAALIETKGV